VRPVVFISFSAAVHGPGAADLKAGWSRPRPPARVSLEELLLRHGAISQEQLEKAKESSAPSAATSAGAGRLGFHHRGPADPGWRPTRHLPGRSDTMSLARTCSRPYRCTCRAIRHRAVGPIRARTRSWSPQRSTNSEHCARLPCGSAETCPVRPRRSIERDSRHYRRKPGGERERGGRSFPRGRRRGHSSRLRRAGRAARAARAADRSREAAESWRCSAPSRHPGPSGGWSRARSISGARGAVM